MFNFKKDTVFTRDNRYRSSDEFEEKGGVLAVWGSPSSGKTTVASKIAFHLASKKKNVVLLLCDATAPMIPCIVPPNELDVEKSLGSILAVPNVNANIVKYNMITHKRNPYITMIGMLKGENEYTYAPYTKVQAEQLIDTLRDIAPYVIIDCTSYIANDILSSVALMEADDVLRLVNCDLKSISYLSSQLPLIQNSGFDMDKHYRVASNVRANQGIEKMAGSLGSVVFTLNHSSEIDEQYLAGNLITDLQTKASRSFKQEIGKICKEVFGC